MGKKKEEEEEDEAKAAIARTKCRGNFHRRSLDNDGFGTQESGTSTGSQSHYQPYFEAVGD